MGCHCNKRAEYRVKDTDIPANLTEYCVKGTDIPANRTEYRVKGTNIPAKRIARMARSCGRYVRKLLAIRACGENCVLATQVGQ
jgi:hypothetical protein